MTRWPLKYGLNPHQGQAVASLPEATPWLEIVNGQVGYINLLDAVKAWVLARELATTLGRIASFGDFIGLSEPADESCARIVAREVSDGIIAPDFTPAALAILRKKKGGKFVILRADPAFVATELETRRENGLELQQAPNRAAITSALFQGSVGSIPLPGNTIPDLQRARTATFPFRTTFTEPLAAT